MIERDKIIKQLREENSELKDTLSHLCETKWNDKIKNPCAAASGKFCEHCDHKDEYILDLESETAELKRLLRLAVEDIKTLLLSDRCDNCEKVCAEQACHCTTVGQCIAICKWKHAEEAMEVLRDEK